MQSVVRRVAKATKVTTSRRPPNVIHFEEPWQGERPLLIAALRGKGYRTEGAERVGW
jgi:hypothetical protein